MTHDTLAGYISNEQLENANPSVFDAYSEDVKTAVEVLKNQAQKLDGMDSELMDAAAEYLKHEVKN